MGQLLPTTAVTVYVKTQFIAKKVVTKSGCMKPCICVNFVAKHENIRNLLRQIIQGHVW